MVTDHGDPPLSSNRTVTVDVEPKNDHSPQFDSTPYVFSFLENSNGSIFQFRVIDNDTGGLGTPGTANISLSSSLYSSSFELDTSHIIAGITEGTLRVLESFDREVLPTFNLSLEAYDTGYVEFRKTSQTTVVIEIQDANDNNPKFSSREYTTMVAENATNGHQFFQVEASDNDTDLDSTLTFSLLNFNNVFAIDESSGWISVVGGLDRATFPSYTLHVRVNDSADHTDTASVIVTVIEVNEHTPQFDPAPPASVTVSEGESYSLNISVSDEDLGPAGNVTLSLLSNTYFTIEDNERLVLIGTLDYEVNYVHVYTILLQ